MIQSWILFRLRILFRLLSNFFCLHHYLLADISKNIFYPYNSFFLICFFAL